MRTLSQEFRRIAYLALVGGALHTSYAQADLRISVKRAQPQFTIGWDCKSLVPAPGATAFASYGVLVSSNLVDWTPTGEIIEGRPFANQTIRRSFSNDLPQLFVKVQSILNFDGVDVIELSLADANLARSSFRGADFFESNLSRANLSSAALDAADFRFTVLANANLTNASALGADFSSANLSGADARNADLSYCDFTAADLSQANLAGADLTFSTFADAQMDFIGLQRTIIDEHTIFPAKTELIWKMVNGKLAGATITNVDIQIANLQEANLAGTVFKAANLAGSDFANADLRGANLLNANLNFVGWHGTLIDDSTRLAAKARLVWQVGNQDFSNGNLANADLSNADLVQARLSGANLTNANFIASLLIKADLSGANLSRSRLQQTDLSGANLQNADLTNARLDQANLTQANLKGAKLTSTTQSGTFFQDTIMPDGTVRNPTH